MHRFQTSRKRYCLWWKSIRQWWSRRLWEGGWSKMNYLPYFHICAVCVNCDVILFNQSTRTQLKSIRSNVHFAECFYKMQFRWLLSLDMCGQKANEARISVFKNSYTPNSILRDKENWEWFPILSMYFVICPLYSSQFLMQDVLLGQRSMLTCWWRIVLNILLRMKFRV